MYISDMVQFMLLHIITSSILTHLIIFIDWKKTLKENTKSLNMSGKETNANTGHMYKKGIFIWI